MTDYLAQLREVVDAIAFSSPTAYTLAGRPSLRLPPRLRDGLDTDAGRIFVAQSLASQLYSDFYVRGSLADAEPEPHAPAPSSRFIEELSGANCGSGYWQDGVAFEWAGDDQAIVRLDGTRLLVPRDACAFPAQGAGPIGVRLAKELTGAATGFYMAFGDQPLHHGEPIVRLYWNVRHDGAVELMRRVTAALNGAGVAFRLKVLNEPVRYVRCDAAVLYIRRTDYPAVAGVLAPIHAALAGWLKAPVPAFTKPLAHGLALAEDPAGADSFGGHRCRLLAEGLMQAHEERRRSAGSRVDVIVRRFAVHGVGIDRPYLTAGSTDDYDFAPQATAVAPSACRDRGLDARLDPAARLELAAAIGRRLVGDAIWHDGRCTWLTDACEELDGAPRIKTKALGPDLYGGSIGVAVFLAELGAAVGDAALARTAIAATVHAVSRANDCPGHGLYTGRIGIALGAARIGGLLGRDDFIADAGRLAADSALGAEHDEEFDLLAGKAGAICGLLALQSSRGDAGFADRAVRLADQLVACAQASAAGCSWRASRFPSRRNLTGLSHGAAGAALALLEVYALTGDERYRATAARAFDYERHWFDSLAGNWPDFREPHRRGRAPARWPCANAWCHGAPGIALSRLRAFELTGDRTYRDEAIVALRATTTAIEAWMTSGAGNYSLCHGLAGNCDVLVEARRLAADPDHERAIASVANAGARDHAARGFAGSGGLAGGDTPSLMLGVAGTGHFYLRLSRPNVASVLAPWTTLSTTASSAGARPACC
jgi:hypothetical protein